MDAGSYMEHIRRIRRDIDLLDMELDSIDNEMISIPAQQYNADKVRTSPRQDKLEKQVIRLVECKEEITAEILKLKKEYIEKVHEAMGLIRAIESREQQEILILRYINNKKWWDILRIKECDSLSSQQRLRDRALDALQIELDKKGVNEDVS